MARQQPINSRQKLIGRYFRGLPVIDAEEPLRIVLNRADIRAARKLDPNNCAFAQACRRLFNSHAVLFLRRTAYVELPDSKGRRVVNRFELSNEVRDKIIEFDKTGDCEEGGFILNPPPYSRTWEVSSKRAARYRRDVSQGKRAVKPRGSPNKKTARGMLGVRDGRGKLGINYAF